MNKLRDLREYNNLTQKDIAKKFNVDQSNYSKYELGKITIPYDLLINLALFYNTSVDYILGLTNVNKPYPRIKNIDNKKQNLS